jgi:hypothetical protein
MTARIVIISVNLQGALAAGKEKAAADALTAAK